MIERVENNTGGELMAVQDLHPVRNNPRVPEPVHYDQYPAYDEVRMGKLADEVIGAIKDDRMTTKRAVSADIASAARVQTQNGKLIEACERELRRRDLPEARREELFDIMSQAARSSTDAAAESRAFQEEQLDHLHKLPWRILLAIGIVLIGGAGGTVLLRAAA